MRYFFDIFDGDNWARDDLGVDCHDDMGARRQAVLALVEMDRDYIPSDGASMDFTIRVRKALEVSFTVHLNFSTDAGPGLRDPAVVRSHRQAA